MRHIFATFFVLCLCGLAVHAEEWKSDDGLFSFTVPESYAVNESQPLLQFHLRHWKTKEYSGFLTVGKSPAYPGVQELNLESFTDGISRNTFPDSDGNLPPDLEVLKSEAGKTQEGFGYCDVTIAAHNSAWKKKQYSRHYAILVNGTIYKLIFTTIDQNPLERPDIEECLSSLVVHATPIAPPPQLPKVGLESAKMIDGTTRTILIAVMGVLVVVLVTFSVMRRLKKNS